MENKYTNLGRRPNLTYRNREHLSLKEVHRLIEAAGIKGRHRLRDRTLLLLMFRHGLRISEASSLKWDAVRLEENLIAIARLKNGMSTIHPLQPDELEVLRQLRQEYPNSQYVFANERGHELTTGAISKIVQRAGVLAGLSIRVHPHMLRHSCGYYLAEQNLSISDIQQYLGIKSIQNTARYTIPSQNQFDQINWQGDEELENQSLEPIGHNHHS